MLVEELSECQLFIELILANVPQAANILQTGVSVPDRQWSILGFKKSGCRVAIAGSDGDKRGEAFIGSRLQSGDPCSIGRMNKGSPLSITRPHEISSCFMGSLCGSHGIYQCDLVRLAGKFRHVMTKSDTIGLGLNCFGWSPKFVRSIRLGVERVEVCHSA